MNISSRIYVAGHEGLVGSNILKELIRLGYKNIITRPFKDLDLTDQKKTEGFFLKEQPEYVFLAAAKVGGILANSTYKADFIYDNLMISANVIRASYKYGVKKLLNLGSSCIYPKLAPQPLKEEYLLSDYLEPTNEPYAIAKIAAIKLCRYYNEQYGTNFISVMPTNLYGVGDNFNLETAHVLPTLIRKFYLAKLLQDNDFENIRFDLKKYSLGHNLNSFSLDDDSIKLILKGLGITKEKLILWGTGKPYREFLHVRDLVDAIIFLMNSYNYSDIGEIINIGSGKDISIKDLAFIIKDIIDFNGEIFFDSSKPDGTPKKLLDVSRINDLGWKYKIQLKDGIEKTCQNYLNDNLILKSVEKAREKIC